MLLSEVRKYTTWTRAAQGNHKKMKDFLDPSQNFYKVSLFCDILQIEGEFV
jgi:hypothetical protein